MTTDDERDHVHIFDEWQLVEAGHGPTCRICGWEAPPIPADEDES